MGIIYITRHGETEWNAEGRIQGHTDVALVVAGPGTGPNVGEKVGGDTNRCGLLVGSEAGSGNGEGRSG